MKSTLHTLGIAGVAAVLFSSFVLVENNDNAQSPKKGRHVRLVKIENGKKMQIDTVFTNDDVFVWNGDTINPVKHFKPGENADFKVIKDGMKNGREKMMIFVDRDREKENPDMMGISPEDEMDIMVDDNDTVGKKIIVRKMKGGPKDHMIFFNEMGPKHFPPVPPVPPIFPTPHIMKFKHAGRVIDLNDPGVVSYKKKDLKGGLEKIEIIRKKADEDTANFDFQFDGDDFMAPEPPEAPEMPDFDLHSDNDSLKMRIIEKKKVVDGKNGKEIEVKVEQKK
jgi:hypothetical protein